MDYRDRSGGHVRMTGRIDVGPVIQSDSWLLKDPRHAEFVAAFRLATTRLTIAASVLTLLTPEQVCLMCKAIETARAINRRYSGYSMEARR